MPFPFLSLFQGHLAKMSIVTSIALSFLLIGLQAIMDAKFVCPCMLLWNKIISAFICITPAIFATVVMVLFIMPSEDTNRRKAFFSSFIPALVWICIFFIDGDYLACGLTFWDGQYTCEKEKCFNWCKPYNLTMVETYYGTAQTFISISKTAGYGLAALLSIIIITVAVCCDCCRSRTTEPQNQRPTNSMEMSNQQDTRN